ncbi:PREDICTED: receptor-type tyrosine-protein phosphatase N2-like, partial [Mesitornis unicolor]
MTMSQQCTLAAKANGILECMRRDEKRKPIIPSSAGILTAKVDINNLQHVAWGTKVSELYNSEFPGRNEVAVKVNLDFDWHKSWQSQHVTLSDTGFAGPRCRALHSLSQAGREEGQEDGQEDLHNRIFECTSSLMFYECSFLEKTEKGQCAMNREEVKEPFNRNQLMKKLFSVAVQSFTWRDDYTQHVIGQELSTIHKIHNRRPDMFASEGSDMGRTLGQNVDNERNYDLENDVNLAKSLQQYLKYLGILSQSAATNLYPRKVNDKASVKSYIYNDPIRYYMMQKPKEKAPPSHQKHAENLRGRTFNQPQPESEMGLDQKTLMAALHTYITQNLSAQNNEKSSHSRTKGSHVQADRFYTSQVSPFDGIFAKGKAEHFQMKKLFQPGPASGVLGPTPEMLNHKSASQDDPKDPLSTVDETLIKDVLKDLEKHQVNVENLSSTELDEIADTIADAIQTAGIQEEMEEGAGKTGEDKTEAQMRKEGAQGGAEIQTGLSENSNISGSGGREASARTDKEENTAKLINFLNENALPENMPKNLIPEESTKTETKKSEDTDSTSSEEINAGVENVKSETFSRELTAAENSESDSTDPSKTRFWIKNALMQDGNSYEEPHKNMGQGLQLEVKSSGEKEYGYIVTVKDPLSVEKGLELIKEVADLLKLQMSAFDDV